MSHFNRFYPRASSSQGIAPMFRMHQQPRADPNVRHEGFRDLNELLHPKLRPRIHINSVIKLIRYRFRRLARAIHLMAQRSGECTVYLPWSPTGWAFAIFKPGDDVVRFMTHSALQLENKFAGRSDVRFVRNVWHPQKPETDYKVLVETRKNIILVFGDNSTGKGKGGTAAVRDHANAFGIPTGWSDSYGVWTAQHEESYYRGHYLEYALEESLDGREKARKQHYAELVQEATAQKDALDARQRNIEEREKSLRLRELEYKQRELALRQSETALSSREARAQRRMSQKKN